MRLITRTELAGRTEGELSELFREVSLGLARTKPSSPERRNALGTLENINRERAARRTRRGPTP